jgi:hypothetical protein
MRLEKMVAFQIIKCGQQLKSGCLSNFLLIILHKAIKLIEFIKIKNSKLDSVQGARATTSHSKKSTKRTPALGIHSDMRI